jgi:hypothetical protein
MICLQAKAQGMEHKNFKHEHINNNPIRSTGCIVVTLITSAMLLLFGWVFFNLYFFGSAAAWIEPFQDPIYLGALAMIGLTIFLVWKAAWGNFTAIYRSLARYRNMRQEKSRIERLMAQTKAEMAVETDNLEYLAEVEKYKQSR